jgi:hypothetical protein
VEGLLCGGQRLQPPASIDTPLPPKSPVFIFSIILSAASHLPCILSAAQNDNGISFFHFSIFPKIPETHLYHGFAAPYPTQITRNNNFV